MTAEQKKMIRDNAQATIDLAEARLRDDRVTDENVRHDLEQIATLARALLAMVGEPSSPWSTKVCSCGRLTAEAPNPHARDACSLVHTVPLSREPSPYVLGADWLAQETARRNRVALGLPEDQAEGQASADEYERRMRDAVRARR